MKEAFRRGRGQLIVLGPIEAPPDHVYRWIPNTTNIHSFFLCRSFHIVTEFPLDFSTQNRSNNLSILPDLDSNRISIHSPIISSDIHGRFSILQEILSLTVYYLKIYYFLALLRSFSFRSIYNTDSQARLKDARILFKDWVPHGKITLFTSTLLVHFPCGIFKCLLFHCYVCIYFSS